MLTAVDQIKAVEIASDAFTPELRKTAFELAVEIALPDRELTDEKNAVLDTLENTLSVSRGFAQKATEKFI